MAEENPHKGLWPRVREREQNLLKAELGEMWRGGHWGFGMGDSTLLCPSCGSRDVININLSMEQGDRVAFYSCHHCEKRWWHKDGRDVSLPSVLELARRRPKRA